MCFFNDKINKEITDNIIYVVDVAYGDCSRAIGLEMSKNPYTPSAIRQPVKETHKM